MKRIIFCFLVVIVASSLTGCVGAHYGSQAQYDKDNDFYFLTDSSEVARIKQDKLAFEKLKSQPVQTASKEGVPQGYEGVLVNFSKNNFYNFIISGPERKGYLLGPGESASDNLIPGTYSCMVFQGNQQMGNPWIFHVTAQKHSFRGKAYHWYVYME